MRRFTKALLITTVACIYSIIFVGITGYCVLRFSEHPTVVYMRNLYIDTALSTMTHQWLATSIFPADMIEAAYARASQQMDDAAIEETTSLNVTVDPIPLIATLSEIFPDLNPSTIPEGMELDQNLDISDAVDLGIKTLQGDSVWAIDRQNGIMIVEVIGPQFVGKLAIIRNPAQVDLATNKPGTHGSFVGKFCEREEALLGINASGFSDPEGKGNGDWPVGLVVDNGVEINPRNYGNYHIIGFDRNHNLKAGKSLDTSTMVDAVQFYPCLVVDGRKNISDTLGLGMQPRSAIGQTRTGAIMLFVIDGRQPGYSIGATVVEVADVLMKYNCWVAINLDGGNSSVMWYKGDLITKTSSSAKKTGRYLPNAWIVLPASSLEPGDQPVMDIHDEISKATGPIPAVDIID